MKKTLVVPLMIVGALSLAGRADAQPAAAPTFNKDVAPIFYANCITCHRPGEVAPMSLRTYDEVRPWARSIRQKVSTRQMPPWFADPAHGAFANDARLSQPQIDTIVKWFNAGSPEVKILKDGWTVVTKDGQLSAHFEHTILVT